MLIVHVLTEYLRWECPYTLPTMVWGQFGPYHIFNVVSTAIVSILLILSTVSTFVLSSRAKVRINTLIKRFLSVSSPIISSKLSWTLLVNDSRKSKTPSVESVSILFSRRYFLNSLLISSKINVALTFVSTSISTNWKRSSFDAIKTSAD